MAIELGIGRLGDKLERISMSPIESEAKLEETLAAEHFALEK